mmetsp:Transcript_847/g.2548  ORF Transcript_847/g.2548 Transcript_847/m.2548 type:complete len:213 (+) Transcript_847:98-736(+)
MSKRAREGAPAAAATPAAATPEEEILRQRLLAKETSLRNLTKRYLAFAAAVETAPVEECEKMYQGLLRELAAYEFGMAKARTMITVNVQQVASYEAMEGEIGAEMSRTSEEISALSKKLEEERTLRQQKEQYAALARRINQLPPRAATQQEIGALSSELETLRREGEELSATMAERTRLFGGFMHALHDLQLHLGGEGGGEAGGGDASGAKA